MAQIYNLKVETWGKSKLTCLLIILQQIHQVSMQDADYYVDISDSQWEEWVEERQALAEDIQPVNFFSPVEFINAVEANVPVERHDKYVVEIAIICDRDFSNLFQNNQTKMLEYWLAMFYDVQLRYNTLPSTKFAFRLNEMLTLEEADQQTIVEVARVETDTVFLEKTKVTFPRWLLQKYGNSASFDIAILAIGARFLPGSEAGFGFRNQICTSPWRSSLVFSVRTPDTALVLAHEMAHVLGVTHDNEFHYLRNQCGELPKLGHLMREKSTTGEPGKRHFFSNCSNQILARKHPSRFNICLQDIKRTEFPLINTENMPGQPALSFLEQCRMLTNSSSVFVNQNEASCKFVVCRTSELNSGTAEFIEPFNGSPCSDDNGQHGECFRDICMPPGIVLRNTATDNCLNEYKGEDDRMSENAVLVNCTLPRTKHMDVIKIRQNGNYGVLLMKYNWNLENEVQRTCLALSFNSNDTWIAKFEKCSSNLNMSWNITTTRNQNKTNEFILFHPETGMCLGFTENFGEVIGSRNCLQNNSKVLWTLMLETGDILTPTNLHNIIHTRESIREVWEEFQTHCAIENTIKIIFALVVKAICVAIIIRVILWLKCKYFERRYKYNFNAEI